MIVQLDTENADRNLTAQVTVLTHTPNAASPMWCEAHIYLGDGAKNLSATGGNFELTITVGGNTGQPDPQIIVFSTAVRAFIQTHAFSVPANAEVIIKVKSPNAADADVDVTAYLYQVDAVDVVAVGGSGTLPELPQAIAAATPTLAQAIMLPYMALRNELQITAAEKRITNDAGVVIVKKALADNGVTYTEDEMVAGP